MVKRPDGTWETELLHLDDSVKKRLVTMVDSKNLVMEGSYNAAQIGRASCRERV